MKILRYALLCALAVTVTLPAIAEDEKELGWASTAEFGYVTTSGNSDVETLSFGSETIRSWETSSLSFKLADIARQRGDTQIARHTGLTEVQVFGERQKLAE